MAQEILRLLESLAAKPPPVRPHVYRRNGGPVELEEDMEPPYSYPAANAATQRSATYWYREALRRGYKPDAAARFARGQALNKMFRLGVYKRIPRRDEY